jgi:hypothetical protein
MRTDSLQTGNMVVETSRNGDSKGFDGNIPSKLT